VVAPGHARRRSGERCDGQRPSLHAATGMQKKTAGRSLLFFE